MLAVVVLIFFVLPGDFLGRENIGVILETVPRDWESSPGIAFLVAAVMSNVPVGPSGRSSGPSLGRFSSA